jgi:ABC-2 type transport system ATP-binding protein
MENVLEVTGLTKKYGSFAAVDNISFHIKEGEIVGLLGQNGAGKTTTIAILMGVVSKTSGAVTIFGRDYPKYRQDVIGKMNYSSAYIKMPWRMKVWEHLYVFAQMYEVDHPRDRVEKMIKTFDLEKHRHTLGGDLSAGNMAKVNLAKAFINYPKLVLLDEPTSSLDPEIARMVREYLLKSQEQYKTTILITSHNMAEIEELADRVIFINHGKITSEGTPEELVKKTMPNTMMRLYMVDGQKRTLEYAKLHHLKAETQERYVELELPEKSVAGVLSDLAQKGVEYSEITITKPTLEDYFIGEIKN